MSYVTEQLQFRLGQKTSLYSNLPVTRQPSPLLFNNVADNIEETLTSMSNLDVAMTLARRDLRLGNVPRQFQDDLDLIPVKEVCQKNNSSKDKSPQNKNYTVKPSKPAVRSTIMNYPVNHSSPDKKIPIEQTNYSESLDTSSAKIINTQKQNIITMRANLKLAHQCLGRPSSKKGYPDPIEEERLQRRVEEQRRHLYRMLYNTKRHVSQLNSLLERTSFRLRLSVLKQGGVMCHVMAAYRSLLSTLHSFIRVSKTMKSSYMTDLKKRLRTEVQALLDELDCVCELLDIPPIETPTLPTPPLSVPQLKILDISKSNHKSGPVTPERDQSLRAAVRSLVKTALSENQDMLLRSTSPSPPKQYNFKVEKDVPKKKPTSNKKFIKPKATSSKNTKKRRPLTAVASTKARPLGKVKDTPLECKIRPTSAPSTVTSTPLEVRGGQLTPFITERELARQAWIDKLCEGDFPSSHDILGSEILCTRAPINSPKGLQDTDPAPYETGEQEFRTNELSSTMVQLLDKLECIEKEEDEIRSRWLHIQYSSPYIQDTGVVLPSADLVRSTTLNLDHDMSQVTHMSHAECTDTGPASVQLRQDKVNSILSYKRAMEQYLKLIKHHKSRDFNPWATINKIVEDIVGTVVQDVCGELLDTCDGLAENMFLSEFLPVL